MPLRLTLSAISFPLAIHLIKSMSISLVHIASSYVAPTKIVMAGAILVASKPNLEVQGKMILAAFFVNGAIVTVTPASARIVDARVVIQVRLERIAFKSAKRENIAVIVYRQQTTVYVASSIPQRARR